MGVVRRRGNGVRQSRRADDPVLHLLLDVRVPARRRPDLAGRRLALQGLPRRRNVRPDDAERRRPAARRRPQPGRLRARSRRSSPTTRRTPTSWPSSSRTVCGGCMSRTRTSSTTSRCTTKRSRCRRCRKASTEGILKGMYKLKSTESGQGQAKRPQLFGSGTILPGVVKAQAILKEKYGIGTDVWSVTSYNELGRDAMSATRWNRLHPTEAPKKSYIETALAGARRAVHFGERQHPRVGRPGSRSGFRGRTRCSERTGSAGRIRVRRCGGTSRSMPNAPSTPRCMRWLRTGRSIRPSCRR